MMHETEYGQQPYDKVMKAEFELRGLESAKHAAFLQYKLMLLEPVIRVHVSYTKKTMAIKYLDPTQNTQKVLDTIKPVRAVQKSREFIEYDGIVKKGYHD